MLVKTIAAEKVLSDSACYLRPVSSLKVDKGRELLSEMWGVDSYANCAKETASMQHRKENRNEIQIFSRMKLNGPITS